MVMGKTHLGAGACALTVGGSGLVALGWGAHLIEHPQTVLLFALVCLAHFLRPDIDTAKSFASRSLGAFSETEGRLWRAVAASYYLATRAPGDPVEPRVHRGLTHTPVGALAFGAQSAFLIGFSQPVSRWAGELFATPLLATPLVALWGSPGGQGADAALWWSGSLAGLVCGALARGLGGFLVVAGDWPVVGIAFCGACAVLVAAPYAWAHRYTWGLAGLGLGALFAAGLADDWAWVALAAALGAYGHSLGDGCTSMGSPLKHPMTEIVDNGQGRVPARWVDHGTPRWLRYPAGSRRESFWLFVTVAGTCAFLALIVWGMRTGVFVQFYAMNL